jgi:HEAT repeat protein
MNRVIQFEPRERVLEKAKKYIKSVELFVEERDQAFPVLLRALKHADRDLKWEIMCVLGTLAKEEVAWPLYQMMVDPSEKDEVRHDAAIQLSVIGPFLKDPKSLADRLLEEIEISDPKRRLHATFALGWRRNFPAAISLIERLYDSDLRVQQAAVTALCNLRDDRILGLLLDRLDHGPIEQKRTILFNLWRFYSKKEEVTKVYLKYLDHEDAELRFDALVDSDGRIRGLALKRLSEEGKQKDLESLKGEIGAFLNDPDMSIKEAALKIIRRRKWV